MKNGIFEIFDPIGVFGGELGARNLLFTAFSTISSLDFYET